AKLLRVPHEHGAIFKAFEQGFNAGGERYARLLQTALRHRRIVVAGTVVTVALAFVLYKNLKQELIPDDDRGFFLVVAFGPEGSSLDYTDGYVRQVEQIIGKAPEVQGYFTIIGGFAGGVNRAFSASSLRIGASVTVACSSSWVRCSPSSSESPVSRRSRTVREHWGSASRCNSWCRIPISRGWRRPWTRSCRGNGPSRVCRTGTPTCVS